MLKLPAKRYVSKNNLLKQTVDRRIWELSNYIGKYLNGSRWFPMVYYSNARKYQIEGHEANCCFTSWNSREVQCE
jgi:hypothetical protein